MSESKAAEDYKLFESLRSRFSDSSPVHSPSKSEPRKPAKRRFDPRTNAPPLVPLFEEEYQQRSTETVKGKWKHSNQTKCNHLNGPDFDALETSSTASLSSAYSEPGTFSPPLGSSLSELSDAGSCETFSEYDIKKSKSRIAALKASFDQSPTGSSSQHRNGRSRETQLDADIPENFVVTHKTAWDKVIGHWKFNGISPGPQSPTRPKMRRPSSEVRVPTPLSTPLGSTDNLLSDGENRSAASSEQNVHDNHYDRRPFLGRCLNKPPSRPSSASCVPTDRTRRQLIMAEEEDRSSSETNLIMQRSPTDEICQPSTQDQGGDTKESSLQSSDNEKEEEEYVQPKEYKLGKFLSISDTMLPAEERSHEYIAEGTTHSITTDKPEEPVKPAETVKPEAVALSSKSIDESEEDTPVTQYPLGKFVSQVQPTPSQEMTEADNMAKITTPSISTPDTANTDVTDPVTSTSADRAATSQSGGQKKDSKLPVVAEKQDKMSPSNRWFDAYMKCKASQQTQRKLPLARKPQVKARPVKTTENQNTTAKHQPTTDASEPSNVEKDDFEKVQKITPSKSVKWLEAMQKYNELRSTLEQPSGGSNSDPASEENNEGSKTEVTSPQRSAEEPTFSTLAQRAQVFGGMRKKPPLRRAKSFQVGSDNASPLASGLTRPTRVLKKQLTSSFS